MDEYDSDMSGEEAPEAVRRQKSPFLYDYYLSVPIATARTPSTSSKIGKSLNNNSWTYPSINGPSATSSWSSPS
jgi:hypothetical protein